MKKTLLAIFAILIMGGCSHSETKYKNPYLPNYSFSITVDMNLPLYSGLRSPINPVPINDGNGGIKGIIAMKISETNYVAFEQACPNQYLSDCSKMTLNGVTAVCPCDDAVYSLFDGQPSDESLGLQYPMKPYRVEVISPTAIRIYN